MNSSNIFKTITMFSFISGIFFLYADEIEKVENKDITIISAQSTSDGKSEIKKELIEECIISLPEVTSLEPIIQTVAKFLNNINGNPQKNEYTKVYNAVLEINYLLHQKELLIITTNSIKGQKPEIKEVSKKLRQTVRFESNSSNGDIFAGKGSREFYFSSAEKAKEDVIAKAKTWLKQQMGAICSK